MIAKGPWKNGWVQGKSNKVFSSFCVKYLMICQLKHRETLKNDKICQIYGKNRGNHGIINKTTHR